MARISSLHRLLLEAEMAGEHVGQSSRFHLTRMKHDRPTGPAQVPSQEKREIRFGCPLASDVDGDGVRKGIGSRTRNCLRSCCRSVRRGGSIALR